MSNHPDGFNLIKIGELARYLGRPISTVRYWANTGFIPTRLTSARGTRHFDLQEVVDSLNGVRSKGPT